MNKIVVVDIGNYNFKYTGDNRGMFSAKYSTRFEPNVDSYERIELDGVTTLIGVGELSREYNKAAKEIIPQVLYAISKATKGNEINLCLLMPINQLPQRDQLINKFRGKTFKYMVNGQARSIKINQCVVLPESQVSYYSLKNPSDYQLIIDIGSRTINWCAYEAGKMACNGTEKLGVYDLYDIIMKVENAKGEDFTVERIEGQIARGRIKVDDGLYKEFLKDVLNRIKTHVNLKDYDVIFTGGGSLVLESILSSIPKIQIHIDAVYSNAIGAEEVCRRMWR